MIDPEEMEALASQLDEEREASAEAPSPTADARDAHARMLAALSDASEALRRAAAECRKAHGL